VVKKLKKYIEDPTYNPESVAKQSRAAMSLCMWTRAMDVYNRVAKVRMSASASASTSRPQVSWSFDCRSRLQSPRRAVCCVRTNLLLALVDHGLMHSVLNTLLSARWLSPKRPS
jgi:hypothetical protein